MKVIRLFFLVSAFLLGSTSLAAAQTCTHYLNATDGADGNDGTSPAQALRSFEDAFLTFPDQSTVCMTAGDYFLGDDEDGIQLTGDAAGDKSMTFVLNGFAGLLDVRFSEDEFVVDIGSGTIVFTNGSTDRLFWGIGESNTLDIFPYNTSFLHTLYLSTGTLDVRDVSLNIEASVGNPSFSRTQGAIVSNAPADAALYIGDGHLIGSPVIEPAERTIVYNGTEDRTAGFELAQEMEGGRIVFENQSGYVTVDTDISFSDGGSIVHRNAGHASFTGDVFISSSGASFIRNEGPGNLTFTQNLNWDAENHPGAFLANLNRGTTEIRSLNLRHINNNTSDDLAGTITNDINSSIVFGDISLSLNTQNRVVRAAIVNDEGGTILFRHPAARSFIAADIENPIGGTIRLGNNVSYSGQLNNAGVVLLEDYSLTITGGNHTHSGSLSENGLLILDGDVTLSGSGRLFNVQAILGTSLLQNQIIEGDLSVVGSANLTLSDVPTIQGNLSLEGTGTVTNDTPLDIRQNLLLTNGHLSLGADITVSGTFTQESPAAVSLGPVTLTLLGDLVFNGGTFAHVAGILLAGGGRPQQFTLGTEMPVFHFIVAEKNTVVTLSGSPLEAFGNVTIQTNATVNLGTSSVRLSGEGTTFTNDGAFVSEPPGGLVFAGVSDPSTPQYLAGTGRFGDINIELIDENSTVDVASPGIRLSGQLTLTRGTVRVPSDRTLILDPPGDYPTLRYHLADENADGQPDGRPIQANSDGLGSLLFEGDRHHLSLFGQLEQPTGIDDGYIHGPIQNLYIDVDSRQTQDGYLALENNFTFEGSLSVGAQAVLHTLDYSLVAPGTQQVHTVDGHIRADSGSFLITGTDVKIQGGEEPAYTAIVDALTVDSGNNVTVDGLHGIGELTISENASLDLGLYPDGESGSLSAGNVNILRLESVGSTIILSSPVQINGLLHFGEGIIQQGPFDLILTDGCTFEAASPARWADGDEGFVEVAGSVSLLSPNLPFPRLRINTVESQQTVTLGDHLTVEKMFIHQNGVIDLAANSLFLPGGIWEYTGGAYTSSGSIDITGNVTAVLNGSNRVPDLRFAPESSTSVFSLASREGIPSSLVIDGTFVLNQGTLDLGLQDLVLAGSDEVFIHTAGIIRGVTDISLDDDRNGELVFTGGGDIRLAGNARLPNVRIDGDTNLVDDVILTIGSRLVFGEGAFSFPSGEHFLFEDGAQIVRRGKGKLAYPPTFTGAIDVYYDTDGQDLGADNQLDTDAELPLSRWTIRDLVVLAGADADGRVNGINLTRDIDVLRNLAILGGDFEPGQRNISLAVGATVHLDYSHSTPPRFSSQSKQSVSSDGPYNLLFTGSAGHLNTTDYIFPASAQILSMHVAMGETETDTDYTLTLHNHREVTHLIVDGKTDGSGLDLDGKGLSVTNNATLDSGIISSQTLATINVGGDLVLAGPAEMTGALAVAVSGNTVVDGVFSAENLELSGDLTVNGSFGGISKTTNGQISFGGTTLVFTGSNPIFTMNNGDDDPYTVDEQVAQLTVSLSGASSRERGPRLILRTDRQTAFTLGISRLRLLNGLINTGDNDIRLPSNETGIIFSTDPNRLSHVTGTVSREILPEQPVGFSKTTTEVFFFPVGSDYEDAVYRPTVITFPGTIDPSQATVVRVSHVGEPPGGFKGFPIVSDNGHTISNTTPFYWQIDTRSAAGSTPELSLQLAATGLTPDYYLNERLDDLRIIQRLIGPSHLHTWDQVGTSSDYDNRLSSLEDHVIPETPLVVVDVSENTLITESRLYSIGISDAYAEVGRIQLVHNSADPDLGPVDIYIDDIRIADDLSFQNATAFEQIDAGTHEVALAPAGSQTSDEAFFSRSIDIEVLTDYLAVTTGLLSPGDFAVNPDGADLSFDLQVYDHARAVPDISANDTFQLSFFHGITDTGRLDVVSRDTDQTLFEDIQYAHLAAEYVTLEARTTGLNLFPFNDATSHFGAFRFDLTPYTGTTITAFASGFLDPSVNQNGQPLHLVFILNTGRVLPAHVLVADESPTQLPVRLRLRGNYPNPSNTSTTFRLDLPDVAVVTISVYDILGRRVVTTAPGTFSAGRGHRIDLDVESLASGLYLYRVVAEMPEIRQSVTGKMTVVH